MNDSFVKPLVGWYLLNRRVLPWRQSPDPYRVWVSEIMLQQTRIEAVISYYKRFMEALPDIEALAECEEDKLLKLWEGLGYYNRARNLKRAAEIITRDYGGRFPEDPEAVKSLPGIGSYTAGAVCSIAFGLPLPAVDGNVMRVWARLTGYGDNVLDPGVRRRAEEDVTEILVKRCGAEGDVHPGDFNQALMELGETVCLPAGAPGCGTCPVREMCAACSSGLTDRIPRREKKQKRRAQKKTVLIVLDGAGVAVRKREEGGLLAGLYEFPNVEGHISGKEAVAFAAREGYDTLYVQSLKAAKHAFSHIEWDMIAYELRVKPQAGAGNDWIFAAAETLRRELPVASAFSAYTAHVLPILEKRGEKIDENTDDCDSMLQLVGVHEEGN